MLAHSLTHTLGNLFRVLEIVGGGGVVVAEDLCFHSRCRAVARGIPIDREYPIASRVLLHDIPQK